MPRKPRNSDLNEAIELITASDLAREEKLKLVDELKETHRKEQAKVKQQPKVRIQRARKILGEQLRPTERDPLEPIILKDGSRRYGPGHADIIFKPDGKVVLMRGSQSLKTDWKSVAGRLGVFAPDPNDPNEREIAQLKNDQSLTKEQREKKITELRRVKDPKQRAPLEPLVFELATMPCRTKERSTELKLPDANMALFAMLSETDKDVFESALESFVRQIRGARAIRHEIVHEENNTLVFGIGFYQKFLTELPKLAQKFRNPPTMGQLAEAIGVDKSRLSKLCKELGFDWLPKEKPGPKPSQKSTTRYQTGDRARAHQ